MHILPKNSYEKGEYPILSAQNVSDGKIDYSAKRYVDKTVYEKENKRINVEKGDVLLTIVATIGRAAVVKSDKGMLLQRSVCALKPGELIESRYLRYCLETNRVQRYMQAKAHGSAQAGLYLNQVGEIMISVPPLEKQIGIADTIESFEKLSRDMSQGIPAEIEARRKQYEYYRDKLLTFKEKQ